MVQAAVIPTSVLPAPQGNTMIPERARLREVVRTMKKLGNVWGVPISKHLTETRLLIRTNDSSWFEVDIEISVDRIISKVVFFEHRVLQLVAALLHIL